MKKVFLPVSLALLAGISVSCSTTEYKKYAGDEAKQVASILRENGYDTKIQSYPRLSWLTFRFPSRSQ